MAEMDSLLAPVGNRFLMRELGVQLVLSPSNKIKFKPNVFLNYHSDNLTVNFVDRGLAHYDTVVSHWPFQLISFSF